MFQCEFATARSHDRKNCGWPTQPSSQDLEVNANQRPGSTRASARPFSVEEGKELSGFLRRATRESYEIMKDELERSVLLSECDRRDDQQRGSGDPNSRKLVEASGRKENNS
jgi:hypothetical protein